MKRNTDLALKLAALGSLTILAACGGSVVGGGPSASSAGAIGASQATVGARDRLYVSDTLLNEILVFPSSESAGNAGPLATISVGAEPQGLWVDAKGILYAIIGSSVEEFKPGATSPFRALTNGLEKPIGVAVDRAGTVYVNDEEGKQLGIVEYARGSTSPTRTITITVPKTIFTFAGGLAFDPKGNLYAQVFFYNIPPAHVYRIAHGTNKVTDLRLGDVGTEAGLGSDAAGNVYVGNQEGGVGVYPPGKRSAARTISIGTEGPSLFAVTRSGEMYFPYQYHETNTLQEYAVGGSQPVNTLSGSFSQPFGAALAAESR